MANRKERDDKLRKSTCRSRFLAALGMEERRALGRDGALQRFFGEEEIWVEKRVRSLRSGGQTGKQ